MLIINILFLIKYIQRATRFYIWISLLLTLIYLAIYLIFYKKIIPKKTGIFIKVASFTFFGLLIFALNYIDVEKLNVDRWSVITSFWHTLNSGIYPYFARSNMGNPPGPMPVYFVIAYPFYLFGELGLIPILGFAAFLFIVYKKCNVFDGRLLFIVFFMMTSPIFLWETLTRSNIFAYTVPILILLIFFNKSDMNRWVNLLLISVYTGMVLSTRNIYILSVLIFYLYAYRKDILPVSKILISVIIVFTVFAFTLLPLVILFPAEFLNINPFVIQSTFLIPPGYIFVFVIIASLISILIKSRSELFFYNGLMYFLTIAVYFLYHVVNSGFYTALIASKADISYFIFCLPFFMYSILIGNSENNNHLNH